MKRHEKTLAKFEPEGLSSSNAGLQERRSAETRVLILEAAIDCLAEYGYARTTTLLVASRAGASRGAMLHHYPTKQALIEATIEYAFYKRMKLFFDAIRSLSDKDRVEHNRGIALEMKNFQSREYQAYLELHLAARTDEELRSIFLPRARQYDKAWREEVRRTFPEWKATGELFDRACELTRSTLEGLLLNRDIWNDPAAEETVVDLLATILTMLRKGEIPFEAKAKKSLDSAA